MVKGYWVGECLRTHVNGVPVNADICCAISEMTSEEFNAYRPDKETIAADRCLKEYWQGHWGRSDPLFLYSNIILGWEKL